MNRNWSNQKSNPALNNFDTKKHAASLTNMSNTNKNIILQVTVWYPGLTWFIYRFSFKGILN